MDSIVMKRNHPRLICWKIRENLLIAMSGYPWLAELNDGKILYFDSFYHLPKLLWELLTYSGSIGALKEEDEEVEEMAE